MKILALFLLSMISTSAFSADWETLQLSAQRNLLGSRSLRTVNLETRELVEMSLQSPVHRIQLSNSERVITGAGIHLVDLAETIGFVPYSHDIDETEIHIYAGSETINCLALFRNSSMTSLTNCRRVSQ